MSQLFLTSSVNQVASDLVKYINLEQNKKLVFITTAADGEAGDKSWLNDDRQALRDAGFKVTDYTVSGKNESQLRADLEKFDVLYLSGGNTFYLLQESLKSGFDRVVKDLVENQHKIYIGTSAGSIIAGPRLPEYLIDLGDQPQDTKLINANGYNFVNFIILPHWGSENFQKRYLEGRLQVLYSNQQFPLVVLTDNQYVKVINGKIELIDTMH